VLITNVAPLSGENISSITEYYALTMMPATVPAISPPGQQCAIASLQWLGYAGWSDESLYSRKLQWTPCRKVPVRLDAEQSQEEMDE
jgi:hypothetical protein